MIKFNAYHFVGDTLRDGRPVPKDGEVLVHDGPVMRNSGRQANETDCSTDRSGAGAHPCGGYRCRTYIPV